MYVEKKNSKSTTNTSDWPPLSQYEVQRQERIKKNKAAFERELLKRQLKVHTYIYTQINKNSVAQKDPKHPVATQEISIQYVHSSFQSMHIHYCDYYSYNYPTEKINYTASYRYYKHAYAYMLYIIYTS